MGHAAEGRGEKREREGKRAKEGESGWERGEGRRGERDSG